MRSSLTSGKSEKRRRSSCLYQFNGLKAAFQQLIYAFGRKQTFSIISIHLVVRQINRYTIADTLP